MWIELSNLWVAIINSLGIPATHMLLAWGCTRMPQQWFRKTPEETNNKRRLQQFAFEHIFQVRRWKNLLPDAAPMFKGFPKDSMKSTDPEYIRSFVAETRRGEFAHWLQMFAIPLFIIWTPWPGNLIVVIWAVVSNLPCIINLRYIRQRMRNLLHKRS